MYLIVGCGLTGVTIAERIANQLKKKVLIIDKRSHIGGNCYDYIEEETGIRMNKYGAHLFHTNSKKLWEYINKFDEWIRYEHKVLSYVDDKYVSIPVNITTVNELCDENIQNSKEMDEWLKENQVKYEKIENGEEMAKSRVGNILYEKMFKSYTIKQWNKLPQELDASVLARIPIRNDFDTRYFNDKYQYLPKNGYTNLIKNMLNNELIEIELNTDFFEIDQYKDQYEGIIYTGPIDRYFEKTELKKLEYRSIDFEIEIYKNMNYYQPGSVVNYSELKYPFTRIVEYKHFLNQISKDTIIVKETTNDYGDPFYPVQNKENLELYEQYKKLAEEEEKTRKVFFVGRLANYKYFNMDQAIENALNFFENKLQNKSIYNI